MNQQTWMASAPAAVVAIPVRNEEFLIQGCLEALGVQRRHPMIVLLLVNNTTDRTVGIARDAAVRLSLRCVVHEHHFPAGHQTAGHARRLAMQAAAALSGPGGVLLSTDADSRVAPDWLASNLAHIGAGADAVAGRAILDANDALAIPDVLHTADFKETAYGAVLDHIESLLDPVGWDPWPRHTEHSGASICVTWDAWRRAGGVPAIPLGEDRAFFAALRRLDARIRHAPDVTVTVSGRVFGRARGGMADTIRRRMAAPDLHLDDALEPALDRVRRIRLRTRLRKAHTARTLPPSLAAELGLCMDGLARAVGAATFGLAWEIATLRSHALRMRPVAVADLDVEMAMALRVRDGLLRSKVSALDAAD